MSQWTVASDENEPVGCNLQDMLHPDGTPGIDNSFGQLLPALEATEGAAVLPSAAPCAGSGTQTLAAAPSAAPDPAARAGRRAPAVVE